MHIAAVGWIYVTLMMAITEETVVAGIMTFFLYGVLPTVIILYVGGSGQRRKRREQQQWQARQERQAAPERKDMQKAQGASVAPRSDDFS